MLDLVVIGGGPAGVAVAVQAQRSRLRTLLLERGEIGGLVRNAFLVENYPGLSRPLPGPRVALLLRRHLERHEVPWRRAEVDSLSRRGGRFLIRGPGLALAARAVVLAVGSRPRLLGLEGEEELCRRGRLHYEVWDLRRLDRGKKVLVVGGGDAAFDYALTMARRGCPSRIVFRARQPRCLPLLAEYARQSPLIEVLSATLPLRLEERGGGVALATRRGGGRREEILEAERVLVAVGRDPDLSLVAVADGTISGGVGEGAAGLKAAAGDGTSPGGAGKSTAGRKAARSGESTAGDAGDGLLQRLVPGLFAAGDARHGRYRQLGIAVGDGLLAAMAAADFLGRARERKR